MRTLTASELVSMRATQAAALPDTCLIQSCTTAQDSAGVPQRTWGTRATGVACRLRPSTLREQLLGARTTRVGDWLLTLAHAQTIQPTDRVVMAGRTFEVVSANSDESERTATRAQLNEVAK